MKKLLILALVISMCIKGNCQKTFTSYYDIFELQKKEVYTISKSGNITGTYYRYHQSGILAEKTQYLEGEKNGVSEEYEDKTQAVLVRANYKSDKLNGKYETWTRQWTAPYKLVQNQSCTIKDGKKDGPYKEWYDNGKVKYDYKYKLDKLDGLIKSYFENGQLQVEANYKEGERYGKFKQFTKNGQIQIDANYENDGKMDEKYYEYDNDLKVLSRVTVFSPNISRNIIDSTFKAGELVFVQKQAFVQNKDENTTSSVWYSNGKIEKESHQRGKIEDYYLEDTIFHNGILLDSIVYKYEKLSSNGRYESLQRKETYREVGGEMKMILYWDKKEEQEKKEQERIKKQEEERKKYEEDKKKYEAWQAEEKRKKEEKEKKEEEERKLQIEKKALADFNPIAQALKDIDIRDRIQYPPSLKIRINGIVGTEYKKEFYYSKIVDVLIETNKKLNSEWKKNGQYFEDKVQLYETYITNNYKTVLKDKKKQLKK